MPVTVVASGFRACMRICRGMEGYIGLGFRVPGWSLGLRDIKACSDFS